MSDIMKFFPHSTPRTGQRRILKEIEMGWNNHDVIVIVAPTAAGKTAIAQTILNWQGSGTLLAPNNIITRQLASATGFKTINNRNTYKTAAAYYKAKASLKGSRCVLNYYQYIANKAYNRTLVVDEAHSLINFLCDKEQVKLWAHLDGFEEGQFTNMIDLISWLEGPNSPNTSRVNNLRQQIKAAPNRFLLEEATALYRGHSRVCLKLTPLTPRDNKPILWPEHRVNKVVLMSATFNDEDLFDLGLDRRRVLKVEVDSPIPVERRVVKVWPIANMSLFNQATAVPRVSEWILEALNHHPEKGMIHTTYSLSNKFMKFLKHDRILFHTRYNKAEVYRRWTESEPKEGLVLVACGMAEGISLDYDLARWQVITKVQYPNLTDPAVAAKMEDRPDSYQWATIKQLVQSCGRVSRRVDDHGTSYIVDSAFNRLYTNSNELFPSYFKEAVEVV